MRSSSKTNLLEHECVGERTIADQLRRDNEMILDNEANVKAIMEKFREENFELANVNHRLRVRATEALQGRWDDPPTSPNKKIIGDLHGELSRLQKELRRRETIFFDNSNKIDPGTTEGVAQIMNQRDTAILQNSKLYVELHEANK